MDIQNARDPEQIRRMKALVEAGKCYFCRQGSAEEKTLPTAIEEREHFYVMKNDFPLEGSAHHYLIIPKRHLTRMTQLLMQGELAELMWMVYWLDHKLELGCAGYSFFVRNGNTRFTGATIDHLHFHFIVGGLRPENATLADALPVVLGYKEK